MTLITAQLKFYRMGPKKMRLIADLIRGRRVEKAKAMLSLINKKGSRPMLKLLNSAVANAKHNHNVGVEKLFVKSVVVDGGPVLKRYMPKAHGRATPVRERTSHVRLVLSELSEIVQKEKVTPKKSFRNKKVK